MVLLPNGTQESIYQIMWAELDWGGTSILRMYVSDQQSTNISHLTNNRNEKRGLQLAVVFNFWLGCSVQLEVILTEVKTLSLYMCLYIMFTVSVSFT